jgi:hypothetical protein
MVPHLPRLPAGGVYEAWWIRKGRHVPAGVFYANPTGTTSVWLRSAADFQGVHAVGVTIERSPGSAYPTGPRQVLENLPAAVLMP